MALRKGMKGDQGIVEWSSEIWWRPRYQVSLALHPTISQSSHPNPLSGTPSLVGPVWRSGGAGILHWTV